MTNYSLIWRGILAFIPNFTCVKLQIAMAKFGAKFLNTIDKSKIHNCRRNLWRNTSVIIP